MRHPLEVIGDRQETEGGVAALSGLVVGERDAARATERVRFEPTSGADGETLGLRDDDDEGERGAEA